MKRNPLHLFKFEFGIFMKTTVALALSRLFIVRKVLIDVLCTRLYAS